MVSDPSEINTVAGEQSGSEAFGLPRVPHCGDGSAPQLRAIARLEAIEGLPIVELARLGCLHPRAEEIAVEPMPPVDDAGRELFDPTATLAQDDDDEIEQIAIAAAAEHDVVVEVQEIDRHGRRRMREKRLRVRGRGRVREAPVGLLEAAAELGRTGADVRRALGNYLRRHRPDLISAAEKRR